MSSWTRHMKVARSKISTKGSNSNINGTGSKSNYSSYLPAVYTGLANRIDRYRQYDQMDQDPEINASLNILADFCTQNSEDFDIPFDIKYKDDMGDTEVMMLEDRLESWCDLNKFKIRIHNIFRGALKYGDQFFIRDPETQELIWVNPMNVDKITVNESTGKVPAIYYIRDVSLNIKDKVMSNNHLGFQNGAYPGSLPDTLSGASNMYGSAGGASGGGGSDSNNPFSTSGQLDVLPVAAEHVVHMSLNVGMDMFWPFGNSLLENIFKVYKQKELLEDSIIIYRVQRAPERRVFKIDVGDMPAHQAMSYVERMKNEIHQRRIPSNKGGSTSLMDAAYNPLSILEDYFFPQTADGRGSDVTTLPGGDNLGQIDDLRWFNDKLIRGLQIPDAYLPQGTDKGSTIFSDGKMGQALVQEHRFNKFCQRWQSIISAVIDEEFKRYLINSGLNINPSSFEVNFKPPMNFASYRKAELDGTLLQSYAAYGEMKFVSRQMFLKKLGWTQDEIIENEKYILQENPKKATGNSGAGGDQAGLNSVGISSPNEVNDFAAGDEQPTTDEVEGSPSPVGSGLNPDSVGGTF